MVREANLARFDRRPAADEGDLRNGMMGKAKRARAYDAGFAVEQAGDAVNFSNVEGFVQGHRWENRRQPSREHRFSATRGTDEE